MESQGSGGGVVERKGHIEGLASWLSYPPAKKAVRLGGDKGDGLCPRTSSTVQTGVGGGKKPGENSRLSLGERRTIGQKGGVTGVPASGP